MVYAAATVHTKIDGLLNLLLTKQDSVAGIYQQRSISFKKREADDCEIPFPNVGFKL